MSPLCCVLRTWALTLLMTTAAPGQPLEPDTATPSQSSENPGRAEAAPSVVAPAPQEARALGQPTGLIGPRGGAAASPNRRRSLDPRVNEVVRVGWALGAVLALLLLLRVVLRRVGGPLAGGGRPSGVLEVLARYPVARGQQLVLLKLSGRIVLLHQTRTALSTLSEVSDPDEVASLLARVGAPHAGRGAASGGFSTMLDRLVARGRAPDDEFARTLGAGGELQDKVVVDLTRRPRRQRRVRGGGR